MDFLFLGLTETLVLCVMTLSWRAWIALESAFTQPSCKAILQLFTF